MPSLSISSPVGHLILDEEDGALVAIRWADENTGNGSPLLDEAARQLDAYFAGKLTDFDLPLRPAGSDFERRVWDGDAGASLTAKTRSYGELAAGIGSGPRAVGGACGKNPIPIVIPCHRVLAQSGHRRVQRFGRARRPSKPCSRSRARSAKTSPQAVRDHRIWKDMSMAHAIRFEKTGGPEVLIWQQVSVGKPGPGQVRLRHTAVGLNYIDTYQRSGLYPMPLPSGLGGEGAGVIEEVGPGVTGLKPGDRVAYAGGPLGAYARSGSCRPTGWCRCPTASPTSRPRR